MKKGARKKKIWNTRPYPAAAVLSAMLREKGFEVFDLPLLEFRTLPVAELPIKAEYLLLSSARSWPRLLESCSPDVLPRNILSVGPSCTKKLTEGFSVLVEPADAAKRSRDGLMSALLHSGLSPGKVLHPCSLSTRLDPEEFRIKTGFEVVNMPVYEKLLPEKTRKTLGEFGLPEDLDAVLFFSASVVSHLVEIFEGRQWQETFFAAAGNESLSALRNAGLKPAEKSESPGNAAMVELLEFRLNPNQRNES